MDAGPRLVRDAGVLALSGFAVRALGMGLMIVLARHLGAEGYGLYQRAEAFVFLFAVVASLGLDLILAREVARDRTRAGELLAGTLLLKLALAPVCLVLLLAVARARGYAGDFLWGIGCYSAVLVLTSAAQCVDAAFQGLGRPGRIALANLVHQTAYVALGLACVLLGRGLRWILSALALASAVRLGFAFALAASARLAWRRPDARTLRFLLVQSLPLALSTGFVLVYQQLDALLLGEWKGNAQVGWYRAGGKFLLVFIVLRESYLVAVYPVFAALAAGARERLAALVTQAVRLQMLAGLFFVVGFACVPALAPLLLGREFAGTAAVLPVLGLLLVPQTIGITFGRALVACGAQRAVMVSTALTLVANVALNVALIPRYGALGAAVAGLATETIVAALNARALRRERVPTGVLRALARPALAALAAAGALRLAPALPWYAALPAAAALYGAGLLALRAVRAAELRHWAGLARAALVRPQRNDGRDATGAAAR